jgi:hypothetical protein
MWLITFATVSSYHLEVCSKLNKTIHLRIITPLRSLLRAILGRSLGNALLAWILRAFVIGWQGVAIWAIVKIYQWVRTIG